MRTQATPRSSCFHVTAGLLAALSLLVLRLPSTFAQVPKSGPQNDPCGSQGGTAAIRTCEINRYYRASQDLQSVLTTLANQKDLIGKRKLQAAQAAWLRFRDASADFEADAARGGELASLLRFTTLATMTEQRVASLSKDVKEGQLTR